MLEGFGIQCDRVLADFVNSHDLNLVLLDGQTSQLGSFMTLALRNVSQS